MDILQIVLIDMVVLVVSAVTIMGFMYFKNLKVVKTSQKKFVSMHENLKTGEKVIFANGIMGTLVSVKDETCNVSIAKDVVIEISRYCISEIVK